MWIVKAVGATSGAEYTFRVDAPSYAPESAVWDSTCRQHGKDNESRTRATREFLDIRPGAHTMEWLES